MTLDQGYNYGLDMGYEPCCKLAAHAQSVGMDPYELLPPASLEQPHSTTYVDSVTTDGTDTTHDGRKAESLSEWAERAIQNAESFNEAIGSPVLFNIQVPTKNTGVDEPIIEE